MNNLIFKSVSCTDAFEAGMKIGWQQKTATLFDTPKDEVGAREVF